MLAILEGQCRCGGVSYRLRPPYQFEPLEAFPGVHLALATEALFRIVAGESLVAGQGAWQLCTRCGTTLFYLPGDGRRFCLSSTLERRELLPGALHNAAFQRGQAPRVMEFLQRGFAVDTEIDGVTPLMYAAMGGQIETYQLLLKHGARPREAIEASAIKSLEAIGIQKLLEQFGCDPQLVLSEAAARLTVDAVRVVLQAGAKVNQFDSFGRLPLSRACENSIAMVRLLLAHGANPSLSNGDGTHALHYCAAFGLCRRLQALLAAGVEVDLLEESSSESALYAACEEGQFACAKLLLEQGADPNLGSKSTTPLMAASRHGSLAIVNLLLERGAEAGRVNDRGLSAKDLAAGYLPNLLDKVTEWVLRGASGRVQHRWTLNAAGERCLKLRFQRRTYRWCDGHAAIVERLA